MNQPKNLLSLLFSATILFLITAPARAGSATWNLNPTNGDWNTAASWTPTTVPNGPADVATFGVSNTSAISLSASAEVNGIAYNSGASAFTISPRLGFGLTMSGVGITNNSATAQGFVTALSASGAFSFVLFLNSASAGDRNTFSNSGALSFADSSSAGSSTFINTGGALANLGGGVTFFDESATAAEATFFNEAGTVSMGGGGFIIFNDSASAGNGTFVVESGNFPGAIGGGIDFFDSSSAGVGVFNFHGGEVNGSGQSELSMQDSSSADHGLFNIEGASVSGALGAHAQFSGNAKGGDATFLINGGTVAGAAGGTLAFAQVSFGDHPSAGNATLIANGGLNGGAGGEISFGDGAGLPPDGGTARIELFGNGHLDLSARLQGQVLNAGSLEGDGIVFLGKAQLRVGYRNLDTVFSGAIEDGGAFGGDGGSLSEVGSGKLTLTGDNTYTGGTTVNAGTLIVNNRQGSATGRGNVEVKSGTLGGGGTIAGRVTLGSSSASFLAPAGGRPKPAKLTIWGGLILESPTTYACTFRAKGNKRQNDQVVANGVTINGATFSFEGTVQGALQTGTVFTVIRNTSTNPIGGTFSNLADGAILTVNGNNLQASYTGGDGNDLTLTVVP